MAMQFHKAERKRAKLRLALDGASNSGKTMGALLIAKGLGGKIAVIDTERGSASLYSHLVEFDTLELGAPFTPERYIEALHATEQAGYDVCVIDSLTHEWDGPGGCLELNEQTAQAKFRGNTWSAWSETKPRHRALIDAIIQSPIHVIATMRSKTETVQGDDKKVKRLGMKTIQGDSIEYEFTLVFSLEHAQHWAVATKNRTPLYKEPHVITEETGRKLLEWLESGAEPPKLSESQIADYKAAIEAAADVDSLKGAYVLAYNAAKEIGDADALKAFMAAKDARKAAIVAAVPHTTNGAATEGVPA